MHQVSRIKERVEEKEGIPPAQQRLIYGGKQMYVFLSYLHISPPSNAAFSVLFTLRLFHIYSLSLRPPFSLIQNTVGDANTRCAQGRRQDRRRLQPRRRCHAPLGTCPTRWWPIASSPPSFPLPSFLRGFPDRRVG